MTKMIRLEVKPAMATKEWPTRPSVNLKWSRMPGRKKTHPVRTRAAHQERKAMRQRRVCGSTGRRRSRRA